jgi:type VI secretion system protein ImpA
MSPSDTLDFDKLLAPIPGANPAGVDLRADRAARSLYRTIRDARDEAQSAERKLLVADDETAAADSQPDWRPVFDLTVQALAEQTKDLEITVFLIEALVRRHGLAGLSEGFRLTRELCERFWDQLYPTAGNAEGLRVRLLPLAGLNDADGLILQPIHRLPIAEATSVGGPFDCAHYRQALELTQKDEATREARIARGAVTVERLKEAAAASSAEFYGRAGRDLARCSKELAKLTAVLGEKCGKDAPPSSRIRAALALYREALEAVAKNQLAAAAAASAAAATATSATGPAAANPAAVPAAAPADGAVPVPTNISNREEAFQTLLKVAEFFRRTEPHTPVSYALEEAVRWGRMKLPDLLGELITDESQLQQVFKRVGIRPPASS